MTSPLKKELHKAMLRQARPLVRRKAVLDLFAEAAESVFPLVAQVAASDLLPDSDQPSEDEVIDAAIAELERIKTGYGVKFAQGDALAKQVDKLAEYDFMSQSFTGFKLVKSRVHALQSCLTDLRKSEKMADGLLVSLAAVRDLDEGDKARGKALKSLNDKAKSILDPFGELSKELDQATRAGIITLDEEALYNYIRNHPDEGRELAKNAHKVFQAANDVAAVFNKGPYAWITGLTDLLGEITARGVDEGLMAQQRGEYRDTHAQGDVFAELDDNPLAMAEALASKHKDNLKIVLKTVGVAGSSIPGWSYISDVITGLVEEYLDSGISQAQEKLAEEQATIAGKNPDEGKSDVIKLMKETVGSGVEALAEKLKDPATYAKAWDALQKYTKEQLDDPSAKFETDWVKEVLIGVLIPPLCKLFFAAFPPDPAQLVTGAELRDSIVDLVKSNMPDGFFQKSVPTASTEVRPPAPGAPITDSRDRAIVESDGRGGATVENSDGSTSYLVAIEIHGHRLWGHINSETLVWVAETLAYNECADWSNRVVHDKGYRVGDKEVSGTWYKPWDEHDYYLLDSNGEHEWARGIDSTGNGLGTESIIQHALKIDKGTKLGKYPWPF